MDNQTEQKLYAPDLSMFGIKAIENVAGKGGKADKTTQLITPCRDYIVAD